MQRNTRCKKYLLKGIEKACFEHGMAYGDFKVLQGRTASH